MVENRSVSILDYLHCSWFITIQSTSRAASLPLSPQLLVSLEIIMFFPDFQLNVALIMSLLAAAKSGSTSECRLLLEGGGDVGERNKNGSTPLMVAAAKGHVDVCELLLEAGGVVGERDEDGGTPLLLAAKFGHSEL